MTNKKQKQFLIIIAGGSASGKTTVARKIAEVCANKAIIFLEMDNYYRDLSFLSATERQKVNFDHPNAFDTELLNDNIERLLQGYPVEEPIYDFKSNNRSKEVKLIQPGDVIIFDGILALENATIRKKALIKIYIDTDSDTRLLRRIIRDVEVRGRDLKSVLEQYETTVKPMHDAFVEPTKKFADIIIPFDIHNTVAIDLIATKIKAMIK